MDSRVMKKLQSEIDNAIGTPKFHRRVSQSGLLKLPYLLAVVEVLRLHPPSPLLLPHYSHKACNVAGYHVPANTQLFVNVWAIGQMSAIGRNLTNSSRSDSWTPIRHFQNLMSPAKTFNSFHLAPATVGAQRFPWHSSTSKWWLQALFKHSSGHFRRAWNLWTLICWKGQDSYVLAPQNFEPFRSTVYQPLSIDPQPHWHNLYDVHTTCSHSLGVIIVGCSLILESWSNSKINIKWSIQEKDWGLWVIHW